MTLARIIFHGNKEHAEEVKKEQSPPLTLITKSSILDVAAVLDPPLEFQRVYRISSFKRAFPNVISLNMYGDTIFSFIKYDDFN